MKSNLGASKGRGESRGRVVIRHKAEERESMRGRVKKAPERGLDTSVIRLGLNVKKNEASWRGGSTTDGFH